MERDDSIVKTRALFIRPPKSKACPACGAVLTALSLDDDLALYRFSQSSLRLISHGLSGIPHLPRLLLQLLLLNAGDQSRQNIKVAMTGD